MRRLLPNRKGVLQTGCWTLAIGLYFFIAAAAQPIEFPQPEVISDRQGLPQAFVSAIVQDRQGFIWMATRDGLCRYDGNRFKIFQHETSGRPSLSFNGVAALTIDHQNRIWIGTIRGGIDVFDPLKEAFTSFTNQPAFQTVLDSSDFPDNTFHRLEYLKFFRDRQDNFWLWYENSGLVRVSLKKKQITRYKHNPADSASLPSNGVNAVTEDRQGMIWIATASGLSRLDLKTNQFRHYRPNLEQPGPNAKSIPEPYIANVVAQPNGDLLLASLWHITVFSPATGQFRSYRLPEQGQSPNSNKWRKMQIVTDSRGNQYFDQFSVLFRFNEQDGPRAVAHFPHNQECISLFMDRSDVLWMGTNGSSVHKYDLRALPFRAQPYRANFVQDIVTEGLKLPVAQVPATLAKPDPYKFRYTYDGQGDLWINAGSWPFYRIERQNQKLTAVLKPHPDNGDEAVAIPLASDPDGNVWFTQDSLAGWYNKNREQWHRFPWQIPSTVSGQVLQVVVDRKALWLATELQGLVRLDRETGRSTHYRHQPNDSTSLSSNSLFCLFQDPDDPDRLWVGTFGSGLCMFDKRTGQSRRLTVADGLPNNTIYSAMPDRHGYLWIGTNKGLCRLNRRTFQTYTFTRDDGLVSNEFNRFHFLQGADGRILMGGLEGMTSFYPDQLRLDIFKPKVEITGLQINNQPVQPGPDSPTGALPAQAVTELTLPHDRNFLTIEFAALQFNRLGKNRYRYRLVGIDPGWVETARPEAIYTDLQPGQYTLELNTANTSGVWSPHIRSLGLTIRPPFWATWWAYGLYTLAVFGMAFGLIQVYLNRLRLRQSILLQQREAEQLREVDEMKTRFVTNITHEFRTPLTLILSPTEQMKRELPDPKNQRRLSSIEKNANQLLRLINQLMDLSKLEANVMTIHETRGDLTFFVQEVLQPFEDQIKAKRIRLIFTSQLDHDYWFDADKLERVVNNLVANATKFTPADGTITVDLQPDVFAEKPGVTLTVYDTGPGISASHLPRIFDRFYQIETQSETGIPLNPHQEGTGIGLSLVKELVERQDGRIRVDSTEGQGTAFTVWLPYRKIPTNEPVPALQETELPVVDPIPTPDESPRILLVEDNDDLAGFIAESLPAHYQVFRTSNGVEGFEKAVELIPDLIISDVLMPVQAGPEMDGYTLCEKLKENRHTSHIPVVLLTAKASVDSRLAGLSRGADDYITKPFHVRELQLRIGNLLERQRRLRDRIRLELSRPGPPGAVVKPAETDPFLQQVMALAEANLDNSAFGVDQLSQLTQMSRMSLYRKLKTLTGLSTGDFIRLYRLKRSTQFLSEGRSVTESAYLVGFETVAHFSKTFRDYYHISPSQFISQP
ncbi:hybrid sensor histidine kinase/response regulator transcription factor [Larkinella sp. GY13]|uniref:hybrid sensor histidine kinase/response regulator transcription factor n=1 Tax=Larkinella sp. GY13 TaxID=3453720 RepID=UPI003EE8B541